MFENLKNLKIQILIIVILGAITWSTSLTNELVGYDDIKLIIRNEKVKLGIWETFSFYTNVVSDSHNVAWTNYPSVIYRPLEWTGSAIGYRIWGPNPWAYHFFVNYSFHIINSIILLLILRKIFSNQSKKSTQISWFVPFIIVLLWTVHPLHNEAVNMLTSGVGFLCASLLSFSAILINLYVQDLMKFRTLALLALSWLCLFLAYHGSEMTIIAPIILLIIFAPSILKKDPNKYHDQIFKIILSFSSLAAYFAHRAYLVSEAGEWISKDSAEFFERLLVLAPEIFFHYIKLFFAPIKLSIDEQHNVFLANAFTPYHILCLVFALLFVIGIFYFGLQKSEKYLNHNRLLSASFFLTGFGIAMSLNIFPLYCLARDRYTYLFCLGLTMTIILALDKYLFTKANLKKYQDKNTWIAVLVLIILALSIRSAIKSLDWHDGEKFWLSTIDSVDDIGIKQIWRNRLMDYYRDPGTDTFRPNLQIQQNIIDDFFNFIDDYKLKDAFTIQYYLNDAKNPEKYLENKYSYIGSKALASALFFNAIEATNMGNKEESLNYLRLAHSYYPEHTQTNLQLLCATWEKNNHDLSQYLLDKIYKEAEHNSFLAKGLMDALFVIKHPRLLDYALRFRELFPNTQVYHVYVFHAALMNNNHQLAYEAAKEVLKKPIDDPVYANYLRSSGPF